MIAVQATLIDILIANRWRLPFCAITYLLTRHIALRSGQSTFNLTAATDRWQPITHDQSNPIHSDPIRCDPTRSHPRAMSASLFMQPPYAERRAEGVVAWGMGMGYGVWAMGAWGRDYCGQCMPDTIHCAAKYFSFAGQWKGIRWMPRCDEGHWGLGVPSP